jgi:2',3'-cyclic-nucleotide 2'-phosphodiesterase (5'-nucleotidase family)
MIPRLVTAAALAAVLSDPAPAQARAGAGAVDLRIVATTDVHGRVRGWDYFGDSAESGRGLARVATIVDSIRGAHPGGTILVDAGDFLQGNALTYVASRPGYGGTHPVIAAMNAMRYDAVVLGNHEFNYGLSFLDRALASATVPVITANVRRVDGKRGWSPAAFVTRSGVRVAIIGATTPWAKVWDRALLAGKVELDDIVASLRRAVRDARAGGADLVVVVAHAGLDPPPGAPPEQEISGVGAENPMSTVAREVPGIDVVIYGHTHREVADTTINGVLMLQPRNWAASAAVASVRLERTGGRWAVVARSGALVRAAGHVERPDLLASVAAAHAAARAWATRVAGRTAVAWTTDSARTADAPIVDFIGEVMRRATGSDLASTAVFSTRVALPPGPITVAGIAQLYPYDNTMRVLRFSGDRLKEFLEQSARYYRVTGEGAAMRAAPDPAFIGFNFEVVVGAEYVIDLSRPPGDRVTGLSVRGRPVAATDTFTITLSNYRASGAGGYGMVSGAPFVKDDQREVRQLLIDELTRRRELRVADFHVASWKLVPPTLAAQVQAAIAGEADFESGQRPPALRPSPSGPPAAIVSPPAGARARTLRIISINDFHGALEARPDGNAGLRGGAAHVAAVIRRLQRECTGTCTPILVDGGDEFQGTPASNLAFGRPVVALLNSLDLAAAALGNHEFDWGQDTLRARMRDARYGIFGANVTYADGRPVPWIRQDTIVERGGIRVGIVGLATESTPRVTMARNVADLRFHRAAPVAVRRARELRARGADVVIAVIHAGGQCNADACSGETVEIAREGQGVIDVVVGGHVHTEFSTLVGTVPVMRARSSGRAVSVLDLPLHPAARATPTPRLLFVGTDTIAPDPDAALLIDGAIAAVRPLVDRTIVDVAEPMRRGGPQHALGNLIADAQRAAAGADVAVMNNGGIRADLRAGPATYGSFFEIQPFANLLVRMTVTGADLRAYFERVVGGTARAHVSGAVVRYDPVAAAGSRVVELLVGGQPVNPAREYTIAMSDFMATGGDGLSLSGPARRTDDLGIVDLDALLAYVRALPGGVVRPDAAPRFVPIR